MTKTVWPGGSAKVSWSFMPSLIVLHAEGRVQMEITLPLVSISLPELTIAAQGETCAATDLSVATVAE